MLQVNYITESIWHSSIKHIWIELWSSISGCRRWINTWGKRYQTSEQVQSYDGRDLYLDYDFDPDKYGDNDKLPAELKD